MRFLGWLLGLNDVTSIESIEVYLSAPWAEQRLFWVCFGVVAMFIVAFIFYRRFQTRGSRFARTILGFGRGLLLATLFITLAGPALRITAERVRKPVVYLLFDGTESMTIQDRWTDAEREALDKLTGRTVSGEGGSADQPPASRLDYLQALLRSEDRNIIDRLQQDDSCRLEAFVFDGHSTSQLRRIGSSDDGKALDPRELADQLTATGQVTALGEALVDVRDQSGAGTLVAVLIFSDFAHNAGPMPAGDDRSPARSIGAPLFTIGFGAREAVDLSVELQTDPKMKKAERTTLFVKLRQSGLQDRVVRVSLTAHPLSGTAAMAGDVIQIGERDVTLASTVQVIDFPFTPQEAGRFEFVAEVERQDGEIVDDNNRSTRQITVIDDYLRLMYVANEPSWEWRFIKEVFHRDRLVGMNGFRTFLGSSDPRVRQTNVLFLPTLTPKRSEFFANDVIFLGDMPGASLSPRFCEMVKEFVGTMGGGLVVISGPRFGPRELAGTALADMLPVIVDPDARMKDEREFALRLTPQAALHPFMNLGKSDAENSKAWQNMNKLGWYQPVAALHDQSQALAVHPTDKCADGKTPQPLIAIRRFGKGEVVYLACDEMWRLRRKYGELYYRQFWSQLIYRLGMSHALGADKRFVARVDRPEYRVEDRVTFTVEAYDENYEPLLDDALPDRVLSAELTLPARGTGPGETRVVAVPMLRRGVFEVQIPVYAAGTYRIRVKDPITGNYQERRFEVTDTSAEHRTAIRDVDLQTRLAEETGGRAYELINVYRMINDLPLQETVELETRNHALWSTPLWFIAVVGLMLGEWLIRRLVHLQ
jgi:hypothetical protein